MIWIKSLAYWGFGTDSERIVSDAEVPEAGELGEKVVPEAGIEPCIDLQGS